MSFDWKDYVSLAEELLNRENEQVIGQALDELRKSRNNADYNEDRPINKSLAERMVALSKQILTLTRIT